jgi:heme-degrading monooxygenase HmoA
VAAEGGRAAGHRAGDRFPGSRFGRVRRPSRRGVSARREFLNLLGGAAAASPRRAASLSAEGRQEGTMSIIRLIHIKIDPSETETAERIWKTECATLMISQKGCISEKLLRARERGEFISYSEWETEADIERYTNSAAHKQIVKHTRSVKGASAVVKLYDLVN